MNLQNLSDDSLHERNIQCAREEREVLTRMLHQLRETEKRRLYCKFKCSSLFDYAVNHLKYSADQADRRIKAMRLLKDLPEVEAKITSGALTLTNLALAQKLFVRQKRSGKVLCDQEIEKKSAKTGAPRVDSKAEIRRRVWRRDQGKCSNCGSTHAPQIEHKIPKAVGGADTLENLCLLCRSCNQRRAIEYYGLPKMQKYLRSLVAHYGSDGWAGVEIKIQRGYERRSGA